MIDMSKRGQGKEDERRRRREEERKSHRKRKEETQECNEWILYPPENSPQGL
jgi:hypothetical protein